jgi:Secretion system C-terminal sorting domain
MKRFLLVLSLPLFLFSHLQTYAQAVNDLCSGAITLTVGVSCSNTLVVKDGSETDSGIPDSGCANYIGGDLWYKLVMPPSGEIRVETDVDNGSITDGGMAVYIGSDCSNLTLLECNDDGNTSSLEAFERVEIQQPAGTTIYIRVWEYNNVSAGTFNICAYEFVIPDDATNDDCIDAIELPVGASCTPIIGSNFGATPSEDFDATIPDPGCSNYRGDDVWFKITVPASGHFEVQTFEDDSFIDGGMAIYSGTCDPNGLTLISCADDNGSIDSTFERIQLFNQTPGEMLFVRIWSYFNDTQGTFNICAIEINLPLPATNDDCIDAIELTIGATCTPIIGTNSGATNSEDFDATIPDPVCGFYSGGDVWFKVVVPVSGNLEIETYEDDSSISDGGMAVYSCTCNPNGLTLLACDDDGGIITNESFERIQILNQTPGETLYIRIWAINNFIGTFNICASETIPPPPVSNDDCIDAIELSITNSPIIGTNIGSTSSEDTDATIPDPGCASYVGNDVWFKVTIPLSGDLAIETYEDDNSITDGGMAVYSGSCGPNGLVLLNCNDDGGIITSANFERIELLGQTPGEILYVRVWSFDNNQSGTFNIFAEELNALGIGDKSINNFTMHPNPANDFVNITFNKGLNENMTLNIFDIQGKLVLSTESLDVVDETALDITNLKSGLYFVKLKNGQQETTRKLIVK